MRDNLTIVSVLNYFPNGDVITKVFLITFSKGYINLNVFRFDNNLNVVVLNGKSFNSIDIEVALDLEPDTQKWAIKVHQHAKNIFQPLVSRSVTIGGSANVAVFNTGNTVSRQMS